MKKNNNILDLTGLRCPETIMMIRKKIRSMNVDDKILILSDDPSTKRDIQYFCHFMEHKLLKYNITILPYSYLLQK